MRILCLDMSTKTGWSVFIDGELEQYGVINTPVYGEYQGEGYPNNIIVSATALANEVESLVRKYRINKVVTEETNLGKNRYAQKILEFIHCVVCQKLYSINVDVRYLDSSKWRALLGMKLDSDQRSANKKLKNDREMRKAEIGKNWDTIFADEVSDAIKDLKPRERNKELKAFEIKKKQYVSKEMRKCKSHGKVTFKHLSVQYVNKEFKLEFKLKDNDIADSICLGVATLKQNGEW